MQLQVANTRLERRVRGPLRQYACRVCVSGPPSKHPIPCAACAGRCLNFREMRICFHLFPLPLSIFTSLSHHQPCHTASRSPCKPRHLLAHGAPSVTAHRRLSPSESQSNNGVQMSHIGLGTWQSAAGEVNRAVEKSIIANYRHVDAAVSVSRRSLSVAPDSVAH